jgi:lipoprotein Spr
MQNKKFLVYIFLLITSLTQSQIVTSKKEAVKKGIYEKPFESKSVATNPNTGILKTTKKSALTKPAKGRKTVINDNSDEDLVVGPTENYLASQMINNAMEFIGVNYRGGGTSKSGMDCSGMVTAVFDIFGLKLPRSSHDMAKVGEKLKQGEIKKGDLVFFRTNGRSTINHVGLVVEANDDEIKFIHSSTQKGVIISSTKEPYYKRTFAQANRVLM